MTAKLADIAADLPEWERDRLTAAEVCIDEILSCFDRHDVDPKLWAYRDMARLSNALSQALLEADGVAERQGRLVRVRDRLTALFPSPETAQ